MKHDRHSWFLAILALALLFFPYHSATAQSCGDFQQVTTPNPGTTGNALVDVAASNDGTAWAVGSRSGPTTLPMILYFDGSEWMEFPVPAEVEGIAFSSAGSSPDGDVWLTGTRPYSVYERELFFLRARDGAIDRIDLILSAGAALDLSATSSSDVWALTSTNGIVHFDGSDWTLSSAPLPFLTLNYPEGIHAAGPDDVWIVGYGGDQRGEYRGYVQHWDGSAWTSIPTPFDGQQPIFFRDIDGCAPDDLWIVGYINWSQHLSLHWDGSAWSQQDGPPSDAPLSQVAVLAPDDAWATSYSLIAGFVFYQWDGTAWHQRTSPDIPGAATTAWRGLAKIDACDVWAVGSYHADDTHHTLAARLSASTVLAASENLPAARLVGNYPNPFNPVTAIAFVVERTQQVSVSVYDLAGRQVATVADRIFDPGIHSVTWTGQDRTGRAVPSGTYMVRMATGDRVETGKMSLVR